MTLFKAPKIPHLLLIFLVLPHNPLLAEEVRVRYQEGLLHGFLALRTTDGKLLAVGDLNQTVEGSTVTSRLEFHFKDGSFREETTVFSQEGNFRVLSNHLIQKGPAFKHPLEVWTDVSSGQVKVRDMKDGKDEVKTEHLDLPSDLANGIVSIIVKNISFDAEKTTISLLAATPKPRVVKLTITPAGEDTFSILGSKRKCRHYIGKVELGGISGVVAPIVGKQPPDTHFWILGGEAPAYLRSDGPLSGEDPVWRIELASPSWRKSSSH